ncbi:hypothetical protein [Rhodocyclus gracilis]|uniref:Uncharacterized protein n=1 Tax=Rhodocyclus tenuis TaxID=1066 RepID=A0A6L5JY59_RHOTE|nr:hypothetical protein [Rhodocyclus gracilis]MQY51128.1 hypothetical protein [Rhodocyclus gracilis]
MTKSSEHGEQKPPAEKKNATPQPAAADGSVAFRRRKAARAEQEDGAQRNPERQREGAFWLAVRQSGLAGEPVIANYSQLLT